ncbi:MAG: hypothetical protein RAK24_05110, partial [TACK group archaeon]|nr:hypothetical protein [TACK group archaeon]
LSPLRLYTDMNGYMVNITPTYPQAVDEFEMKIKEFIKACKGEAPDPIDPYDMVKLQFLVDAVYRSASAGKEVSVKLPSRREAARFGAQKAEDAPPANP